MLVSLLRYKVSTHIVQSKNTYSNIHQTNLLYDDCQHNMFKRVTMHSFPEFVLANKLVLLGVKCDSPNIVQQFRASDAANIKAPYYFA